MMLKTKIVYFLNGILFSIVLYVLFFPLFSDYRKKAERDYFIVQHEKLMQAIEDEIRNKGSVSDISKYQHDYPNIIINKDGWFIVVTKKYKQKINFIPRKTAHSVEWEILY